MTDIIANLFVDVHPSKAKQTLFLVGNCFLIASTVSEYSLRKMLLRVLDDGSTSSLRNALYNRRSSRFDIAFHGISAEQILTSGSDFKCLGESWRLQSP